MAVTATRLLDNYIDGELDAGAGRDRRARRREPGEWGGARARAAVGRLADLDDAVRAAREALPEWRAVSTIARARKLFELRERLDARARRTWPGR